MKRTLAILGGPESGKTTYLGALVDALQEKRLPGLTLTGMPEDARAWEQLTDPLLDGHYPQRTKAERHTLELPLELGPISSPGALAPLVDEPTRFAVRAGDHDGEEVERLFRDRNSGFSAEWRNRAEADGLLIFLRPPAIRPLPRSHAGPPPSEAELWQSLAGHQPVPAAAPGPRLTGPEIYFGQGLADDEVAAPPPALPGDPVVIPTVLTVIELLQFIRHVRGLAPGEKPPRRRFRIALLVAAWDAVEPAWQARGAGAYLGENLPLLEDFLWSNFHGEDVYRFGLSSTGGDLNDVRYRQQYEHAPGGFVTWTDATGQPVRASNLSIPLLWTLFGDRALIADVPATP